MSAPIQLTDSQRTFARVFAQRTGLDRNVVLAWVAHEQGTPSSQQFYQQGSFYGGKPYNNWLNIGVTSTNDLYTGANATHNTVWGDPVTAAIASAQWLVGKGPITRNYGPALGSIRAIASTASHGVNAQLAAIANSGWAAGGYAALHSYYLSIVRAQHGPPPISPIHAEWA